MAQTRVIAVKVVRKWLFLNMWKAEPVGFADGLDMQEKEKEEYPVSW